ncbi:MAG TPA: hypothetical protein VHO02_08790 [Fibrobacteria bacterium]|jgi:hypothetical protein|nr:hypothetical protein [Fibrobacteria bacterium]
MTRAWMALSAAALAALLSGCGMPELAGGSSSTETGEKVALTGRVMNGNHPVPGVAVTLTRAGLTDTTDATGTYRLIGNVSGVPEASAASPDTLLFELNGGVIATQGVTGWVAAESDLQLVRRGFSGPLLTDSAGDAPVGRVEGVLTGDGIAAGDSLTATFYYSTLSSSYSGFLYFPPPGAAVRNYAVRVDVYDLEGRLVGRSASVPFSSLAGNITLPAFHSGNFATAKTNAH